MDIVFGQKEKNLRFKEEIIFRYIFRITRTVVFYFIGKTLLLTYKSFDSYKIKTQCARMQEENVTACQHSARQNGQVAHCEGLGS
jgi:hypothetical protein